jgi:prepilin-type N-terminal cleavage/methylation domain-containing protein
MQPLSIRIQNSEFRVRRAFTLAELMIVITIIGILAGLSFSAFSGTMNLARQQRTGSIINKIDQLISERWEGYRTRAIPLRIAATSAKGASRTNALTRLTALRELMRFELPDRISDLCNPAELKDLVADNTLNTIANFSGANTSALNNLSIPALARAYKRRAGRVILISGGWSMANESSECLYLILSTMRDGDKSALDYFDPTEIGDTDGDGMLEILDGWGTPIQFLRWPAGYAEQPGKDGAWGQATKDDDGQNGIDDPGEAGWAGSDDLTVNTIQTRNYLKAPDPFDPGRVDPRWQATGLITYPYAIYPLIFSAGPDKSFDINLATAVVYSATASSSTKTLAVPPSDPYFSTLGAGLLPDIGRPGDFDSPGSPGVPDGALNYYDNITNHSLRSQQ